MLGRGGGRAGAGLRCPPRSSSHRTLEGTRPPVPTVPKLQGPEEEDPKIPANSPEGHDHGVLPVFQDQPRTLESARLYSIPCSKPTEGFIVLPVCLGFSVTFTLFES